MISGPDNDVGRAHPVLASIACAVLIILATTMQVSAHEWLAHRLRGPVHIVVNGAWVAIARGDIVHSGSVVRTGPSGTVEFRSGQNSVALAPDTQIKFIDWTHKGQTWVQQWFGEVEVDVEVHDASHFAVQTPMMVAVVKGTRFRVSNSEEQSAVTVIRGTVAVEDTVQRHYVDLGAGQSVSGGNGSVMSVSGSGTLPVVVAANGRPVVDGAVPPIRENSAPLLENGHSPSAWTAGNSDSTPEVDRRGNRDHAPDSGGDRPGNSGNAPGHSGDRPGNSGNAPGHGGDRPGNSGNAPGHSGDRPGNSGNAPGHSGDRPGNSGNAPSTRGGS